MEFDTVKWLVEQLGWQGMLIAMFLLAARWYVNVKWPADRQDMKEKREADHAYRMAHTEKIDLMNVNITENTRQTERNTAAVDKLRDSFLTVGIHNPKEF